MHLKNIMKKILLLLVVLLSLKANAQNDSLKLFGQTVYPFIEAWQVSAGAGTSIILGDVAPLPKLTLKKNTNEYKFGVTFRLGKMITRSINMNIEFLRGNVSGMKEKDALGVLMDMSFKGDYWGLTLNAKVDVMKLFPATRGWPFSVYGRVGIGPVYYRALMTHLSSGAFFESAGYENDGQTKSTRRQATVIPIGAGFSYDFTENFRVEAGVDLYNSSTDFLDAHHGITSDKKDKFLIVGGSVVYCFDWD
jgi:opacity protein-like surface antigen